MKIAGLSLPITSRRGARALFCAVLRAGLNFHPEEDPKNYVDAHGRPSLAPWQQVQFRQRIREVGALGLDPSEVALEAWDKVFGS